MKSKRQIKPDLLIIAVLTLMTILTWITFDVYRILKTQEIPKIIKDELAPLNPEIDFGVFDYLRQKR